MIPKMPKLPSIRRGFKAPRGTRDILPEDQQYWHHVRKHATDVSRRYNYQRIDTPVFEDAALFVRSVGEDTDIVEKEMYTFEDKGGSLLTLRPEGTGSICRAYLEHGMGNLTKPVRLYYFCPVFRYERPQAGRYRQHHQFGVEAIGSADAAMDAEVISLAWDLLSDTGIPPDKLTLHINSIGCLQCRPAYITALKKYFKEEYEYEGPGCRDCQRRLELNPLRLMDCKEEACQKIADLAPKSTEYLCPECEDHHTKLQHYLEALGLSFSDDYRLVRGLDYYTRTVFEIRPWKTTAQSAIVGGGRYDYLIEQLGGPPTPAVGFGAGLERIILNLQWLQIDVPKPEPRLVVLAYLGERPKEGALWLADQLRKEGIPAEVAVGRDSLRSQLRYANTVGAKYAIIIGDEEIETNTVTLRDMAESQQERIPVLEVAQVLCARLGIESSDQAEQPESTA